MSDQKPGSIEQDMEQTRKRLAATLDQLVHRASPKTIAKREVASVRGYFIGPDGSPRQDNIAKVAGGIVGAVVVMVLLRKLVN